MTRSQNVHGRSRATATHMKCFALALAAISIAGCGNKDQPDEIGAPAEEPDEIGVSAEEFNSNWAGIAPPDAEWPFWEANYDESDQQEAMDFWFYLVSEKYDMGVTCERWQAGAFSYGGLATPAAAEGTPFLIADEVVPDGGTPAFVMALSDVAWNYC